MFVSLPEFGLSANILEPLPSFFNLQINARI